MVEATRRAKVANPVADSLSQGPNTTKQKSSSTFRDLLSDAVLSSPANVPAKTGSLRNSPISAKCQIGRQHSTPGAAARTHSHGGGAKGQSLVAIAMDQPVAATPTTEATTTIQPLVRIRSLRW